MTYKTYEVETVTYHHGEEELRKADQDNGLATSGNVVGRLKDFENSTIYMVPGHDGISRPMHQTGRLELNSHPSFSSHGNHPIQDQLVEMIDVFGSGVGEDGAAEGYSRKWVSNIDLLGDESIGLHGYEQLIFNDTSHRLEHKIGGAGLRASNADYSVKLER